MHSKETALSSIDRIPSHEASNQEESNLFYTSASYQKILDYHVVEILLTTVVFGVVILLHLHR